MSMAYLLDTNVVSEALKPQPADHVVVWLAAQRRKNWPRRVISAALALSVISLVQVIGQGGLGLETAIEVVSCALTAAGLYFSFTGDAKGWFNA